MQYARNTDPETSHNAGEGARKRALPQRDILLLAYWDCDGGPERWGLTDEEAGVVSRLIEKPGCCYWKRCSELRQLGLIEVSLLTRKSRAGEQQQVCFITEAGRARARSLRHSAPFTPAPVRRLEAKVDVAYLRWLENVVDSARLVARFDGTDRASLDNLQRILWEGSDRS